MPKRMNLPTKIKLGSKVVAFLVTLRLIINSQWVNKGNRYLLIDQLV